MTNKLARYSVVVLLIILNICFFNNLKRARKEIKELKIEQVRLLKRESEIMEDITKRNKEIGEKNEKIKYYIQAFENNNDKCFHSPINNDIRRLLQDAGI